MLHSLEAQTVCVMCTEWKVDLWSLVPVFKGDIFGRSESEVDRE